MTWATDLVGSTNTTQVVSQASGAALIKAGFVTTNWYSEVGQWTGGDPFGALYLGKNITPSNTNYALLSDGSSLLQVNTPASMLFMIANATQITLAASGAWTWSNAVTSAPTYSQTVLGGTGATAGLNMVFTAQAGQAQTGSNANNAGGSLILNAGVAGTGGSGTAGTQGSVFAGVGAPSADAQRGYFQVQEGGATNGYYGKWLNGQNYGGIWLGTNITPNSSNYAIIGTSGSTQVSGGTSLFMLINGSTSGNQTGISMNASGIQLFTETFSLGGGAGVLGILNAATVPTSNPTGGGVLYAQGGALKWRGSSGTVTTIASA